MGACPYYIGFNALKLICGIHILCNRFNPNRLFNPTHKKLTPKQFINPCGTPFCPCSFLSAFQLPMKTKRNSLSSDLSLYKIQKLSNTIAESSWLQLAATASHSSTAGGSSGTFLCLSFGRWRCYPRCHHHWWPPGPPLSLYCLFSFIFYFFSHFIFLFEVTESLRVLFSDWVSFCFHSHLSPLAVPLIAVTTTGGRGSSSLILYLFIYFFQFLFAFQTRPKPL